MATTQAATDSAGSALPAEPGLPPDRDVDREFTVKARSQRQQIVRHFLHNKVGMTGLVIFVLMLLFGFVGPLIHGVEYGAQNRDAQSVPPGTAGYLLGSDEIGRDVLAGLMQGVQRSLFIVLLFVAIALPLGVLIGSLAGYFGTWIDNVLMRIVDLILTVPLLVVLLVVASNFPGARTPLGVGIILGLFGWLDLARIVRSQFLSLREKEYVEAAHALGASNKRIIFKHLIPNSLGALIVWTTLAAATAIILEASLTYLGFGVNGANQTSLGRLVSDGVQAASTRPWLFYFPGITLLVIVLSINLIGDGIRDAFDPSNRRVRA
ncbi:ABC transporter permease [Blastococcus sp. SYSU D00669]